MTKNCYDRANGLLNLPHGALKLPAFFPDATYGYVRSMTGDDLNLCGTGCLMMNAFHLMRKPGISLIQKNGGAHKFFNWDKPIATDSGGFQIYSMIRENKKYGSINNNGIVFHPERTGEKMLITPEKIIRAQLKMDTDIVICLDDCTHSADSRELNKMSVKRTLDWAAKCRSEFNKVVSDRKDNALPLLFAVIQGGSDLNMRKKCAEGLLSIGFDGYGFGGYPFDESGNLMSEILEYTRELVPGEYPLFALGIGHPRNIIDPALSGYDLFDCSLPARDARAGRLFSVDMENITPQNNKWFSYIYVTDKKHYNNERPVSEKCGCYTCRNYSLSFLHYVFRKGDSLYSRLATIHNLRTMNGIMEHARKLKNYREAES